MSMQMGTRAFIPLQINATDLSAGTGQEIVAPFKGVIVGFRTTVQVAISTGGVIKLQKGSSPADVAGASITIANSATVGTPQSAISTVTSASRKVEAGERVTVNIDAAFNGGGAVNVLVEFGEDANPEV